MLPRALDTKKKKVAFYKLEPSKSLPMRPGPSQSIRSCFRCLPMSDIDQNVYSKFDFLEMKSFDNLKIRSKKQFPGYQSIQYHIGQLDVLKQTRLILPQRRFLYIVSVNEEDDLNYLKAVLEDGVSQVECELEKPNITMCPEELSDSLVSQSTLALAILIRNQTCCLKNKLSWPDSPIFNNTMLMQAFEFAIKKSDENTTVIPVTITKDHDNKSADNIGSCAVQILEPYLLTSYLQRNWYDKGAIRLTIHICHDTMKMSLIMAPNLVAFLLLNLNREIDGVAHADLVDYIDWFRHISIDLNLQFGFTGDSDSVAKFGLMILKNHLKEENSIYYSLDDEKLMDYGEMLTPMIAYYGIVAKAIIIEHNTTQRDQYNNLLVLFRPDVSVRVSKENVLKIAQKLSLKLETKLPIRRPCQGVDNMVEDALDDMSKYRRFFKIDEPRVKLVNKSAFWIGDFDVNDEHKDESKKNQLLEAFIVVTQRPYRLDRMNLFINAVNSYLI